MLTIRSRSSSRLYPEIISDEQRQQYKTDFDSDLTRYKTLCADMEELSDQIHQLSRELDRLDVDSIKYQVKDSSSLWLCSETLFCLVLFVLLRVCVVPFFREWQTSITDSNT